MATLAKAVIGYFLSNETALKEAPKVKVQFYAEAG